MEVLNSLDPHLALLKGTLQHVCQQNGCKDCKQLLGPDLCKECFMSIVAATHAAQFP
jgi:hypothetical protein